MEIVNKPKDLVGPHDANHSGVRIEELPPDVTPEPQRVRIRPSRGWVALNLKDLWVYRELLYFLTWRDIKVRYKQTLLGASWAIIQPFFTMLLFTLFFGKLAHVPSDGVPYPIFAYAGLLPERNKNQLVITVLISFHLCTNVGGEIENFR